MKKAIREWAFKFDWFKLEVEAYQLLQKKQKHHERWAKLMHSDCTVRELRPEKLEPFDTLAIVTDDGLVEEWRDGEVVERESMFIDSANWG